MVKIAVMVAAGLFGFETYEAKGQEYHELKGPKAKNYKPWKEKARKSILVINTTEQTKKGPAFKNEKAWERSGVKKDTISTNLHLISRQKGPKAKNQTPWQGD